MILFKNLQSTFNLPTIRSLSIFSNIFKEKLPTPLGRWRIDDSIENKNIRATFANYDSCGDNLCGNPNNLIDHINYIKNKDSKDKFIVIGDDVVKIN
jgi:hypothetical protein